MTGYGSPARGYTFERAAGELWRCRFDGERNIIVVNRKPARVDDGGGDDVLQAVSDRNQRFRRGGDFALCDGDFQASEAGHRGCSVFNFLIAHAVQVAFALGDLPSEAKVLNDSPTRAIPSWQ